MRPSGPSKGSTAATIPRRFRTVANMPVRGIWVGVVVLAIQLTTWSTDHPHRNQTGPSGSCPVVRLARYRLASRVRADLEEREPALRPGLGREFRPTRAAGRTPRRPYNPVGPSASQAERP